MRGEDESCHPDIDSMIRAGVDIDPDGGFDPSCLLEQPLDQDIDDLDELGIDVDSVEDFHVNEGADGASPSNPSQVDQDNRTANPSMVSNSAEDESGNDKFYYRDYENANTTNRSDDDDHHNRISSRNSNRQNFFRSTSPVSPLVHDRDQRQYNRHDHFDPKQNVGDDNQNRCSPHEEYDPHHPYNSSRNSESDHGSSSSERQPSIRHPRSGRRQKRDPHRIVEVQQRILHVQQKIREAQHETTDQEQMQPHHQMMGDHRHNHQHYEQQDHGFPHARNQDHQHQQYQHHQHHRHHQQHQHQHEHHSQHEHENHSQHRHHQYHQHPHHSHPPPEYRYAESYGENSYNSNEPTRDMPRDSGFPPKHSYDAPRSSMRGVEEGFRGGHPRHDRPGRHRSQHPPPHQSQHPPQHPTPHLSQHPPPHLSQHPPPHPPPHPQPHKSQHPPPHQSQHPPPHQSQHPPPHQSQHPPPHHHHRDSIGRQSMNGVHSPDSMHASGPRNDFGPHDQMHPMNSMQRRHPSHPVAHPPNGMPPYNKNGPGDFGGRTGGMQQQQQHVVGGMSRSLNGIPGHGGNSMANSSTMQKHGHQHDMRSVMSRSLNGPLNGRMHTGNMNSSNNGRMQARRGIQSMSDSLNGISNGTHSADQHKKTNSQPNMMDRSNNEVLPQQNTMDRSNNRSMQQQRGIQSMSESLNGIQNANNGINTNRNNAMNNNNVSSQHQMGIQPISRSHNGPQQGSSGRMMSRSLNGMAENGGSGGFRRQHQGHHQHHRGPPSDGMQMSSSLNGVQNMQQNYNDGGYRRHPQDGMRSQNDVPKLNGNHNETGPHQPRGGQNALQGMSQSLNGAQRTDYGHFSHQHPSAPNQLTNMMANRDVSMNTSKHGIMSGSIGMSKSTSASMNESNSGPVLNNSNVPSAPLLNQVSNLANLPNRGGGNSPGMMKQSLDKGSMVEDEVETASENGGSGTSKLGNPLALAEATMRSASSRKLIRDLGLSLVKFQRDSGSGGQSKSSSSPDPKPTVVKAKRNSGRESYSKLHMDAPFRDHARQLKAQKRQTPSS